MKVFVWSKLKRHKYLSSFSDVTFVREVKVVLFKCPLIPAGLNGLTPEKKNNALCTNCITGWEVHSSYPSSYSIVYSAITIKLPNELTSIFLHGM